MKPNAPPTCSDEWRPSGVIENLNLDEALDLVIRVLLDSEFDPILVSPENDEAKEVSNPNRQPPSIHRASCCRKL